MEARPLKDVFTDLLGGGDTADSIASGDAATPVGSATPVGGAGVPTIADLPAELVAQAVVNYASTAPPEVAEHLAPFVTSHSGVPLESDAGAGDADWARLFADAPMSTLEGNADALDPVGEAGMGSADDGFQLADLLDFGGSHAMAAPVEDGDFGGGAGDAVAGALGAPSGPATAAGDVAGADGLGAADDAEAGDGFELPDFDITLDVPEFDATEFDATEFDATGLDGSGLDGSGLDELDADAEGESGFGPATDAG